MHHPLRNAASLARGLAALLLAGLCAAASRAADDARFSATLSAEQRTETGLDRLTSDEVAVIDALVHQDQDTADRYADNPVRRTAFSARRTARERDLAGLASLTPAEVGQLDRFVALRIPPRPAPAPFLPFDRVQLDEGGLAPRRAGPEIHGSLTLAYGWSRGGSVRGAESHVTYADPRHRFALSIGYAEYHGTGRASCLAPDGADGFSDRLRAAPLPAVLPDEP